MTQQQAKIIQQLLSDVRWATLEEALKEYMLNQFVAQSARRDTEFFTIWELASREGGQQHLQGFMDYLESEASKV